MSDKILCEKAFERLTEALHRHVEKVNAAFAAYAEAANLDKITYSESYISQRIAQAKEEGKRTVQAQIDATAETVKNEIDVLRTALSVWAVTPPDNDILTLLRAYKDFDIPLSVSEAKMIATFAHGNFMTIRALRSVAENSGLVVNFPNFSDFEKDLQEIERGFSGVRLYAPTGDGHAADLLPNKMFAGIDYGPATGTDAAFAAANAKSLDKKIPQIAERWAAVTLSFETKETAPSIPVTEDTEATAVEQARLSGAEQAEAYRRSAEGLKHYL